MVVFLKWCGRTLAASLNGIVRFALALVIIGVCVGLFSMLRGDGMPDKMVLSLDLRAMPVDSDTSYHFRGNRPSVMDIVLGLDKAARDPRVKGVFVRMGEGGIASGTAEELADAFHRFRSSGKFIIVHAENFYEPGLGTYVTAAAADQIWMQPMGNFLPTGAGAQKLYLRGVFDKLGITPQMIHRSEYKSYAEMFMNKSMSDADREQTVAYLQSTYNSDVAEVVKERHLKRDKVVAALNSSPQFSEAVLKAGLIDKLGYDDDAKAAAVKRAGDGAETVSFAHYDDVVRAGGVGSTGNIAIVNVCGGIVDGASSSDPFGERSPTAGGDDIAAAIRDATKNPHVKAIILRVSSPGGSVTASDQILNAVIKAKKAGKPVVVSMGWVAASGGYYISSEASKIVAHPATITGSIGVVGGKMSGEGLLKKVGVGTAEVKVGGDVLMSSPFHAFSEDELKKQNQSIDAVYADFKGKVAKGRHLKPEQVEEIARGRVWTGVDAKSRGLVDHLGGFWMAVNVAKKLAKIPENAKSGFVTYPHPEGFVATLRAMLGQASAVVKVAERASVLLDTPVIKSTTDAMAATPKGLVEMRAGNLSQD